MRNLSAIASHEHGVDLRTEVSFVVFNEAFDDAEVQRGRDSAIKQIAGRKLGGFLGLQFLQERGNGCNHANLECQISAWRPEPIVIESKVTTPQYLACPGVRGNGMASRTLASPVTYARVR